jgi:cyclase
MGGEVPASRHFTLHELGNGVYAAIANDGGWAICNAGIVDLGDQVLVFDTFVNQEAAADLKNAAVNLTGKEVGWVINSHYHSDHVKGNQVFAGAKIVATAKTRKVMVKVKEHYERDSEAIRKDVQKDLEMHLANHDDPDTVLFEGYDRGHLEGLPTLKYTLPDTTFDSRMALHGSKRTAEAITYGGGHTVSDAILYLPEDGIAFMGDLLFAECHPYFADGDPEELFRVLDRVEALEPKVLVPGHGPVGASKDIAPIREYFDRLQATVDEARNSGGGLAQATEKPVGPPFDAWKWRSFYKDNLEFLFQSASGDAPDG